MSAFGGQGQTRQSLQLEGIDDLGLGFMGGCSSATSQHSWYSWKDEWVGRDTWAPTRGRGWGQARSQYGKVLRGTHENGRCSGYSV